MSCCEECGGRETPGWTGKYDTETGDKVMKNVCEKHLYLTCDHIWGNTPPWKIFGPTQVCSKCGIGWWD